MDTEKERAVEGKSGSAVISKGYAWASGAMSRLVEILKRGARKVRCSCILGLYLGDQ
jgi:hypothetical protein